MPDADKPQDLAGLEARFPPLLDLLQGMITADAALLVELAAPESPASATGVAMSVADRVMGAPGGTLGLGGTGGTDEMAGSDGVVEGDGGGARSLAELLAERFAGSLTGCLTFAHGHFQRQMAILRAANHIRAARLLPAASEQLARYQTALDNDLYKVIRALHDAQTRRRELAVLNALPVAAVAG